MNNANSNPIPSVGDSIKIRGRYAVVTDIKPSTLAGHVDVFGVNKSGNPVNYSHAL